MFEGIFKRIQKHLEARRKWNRTKRWMQDRAQSRLVVSLYYSGSITSGMVRRRI